MLAAQGGDARRAAGRPRLRHGGGGLGGRAGAPPGAGPGVPHLRRRPRAPATPQGTLVSERTAEATTAAALRRAGRLKPPFFLWVHYYDPHEEYRPPTRFADAARGPHRLYDGEIAFMDEQIGELLEEAARRHRRAGGGGPRRDARRARRGHPRPAALPRRPAGAAPPRRPGRARRPGQRLPGAHRRRRAHPPRPGGRCRPPGLDGRGLLPLPAAPATTARATTYTESFLPFFAYKWYPLRSLGTDRFLYLQGAEEQPLRSRRRIPARRATWRRRSAGERRAGRRSWSAFLKAMGEKLDTPVRPENVLTEEQRRQLASLGYLGGAASGPVTGRLCPIRAPWPASPRTSTASPRPSRRGTATRRCRSSRRSSRRTPTTSRR